MSYTAWSVVFGEQPTAAKWNQLGANDAGFKDGTNLDNGFLHTAHLGSAGNLQVPIANLAISAGVSGTSPVTIINMGGFKIFTTKVTSQVYAWTLVDYTAAGFTSAPKVIATPETIGSNTGYTELAGTSGGTGSPTTTSAYVLCRKDASNNAAAVLNIIAIGV